MNAPIRPTNGAEVVVEAMYFVGMMFWIWGVPGSMVIVSDAAPNRNAGIRDARRDWLPSREAARSE